MPRSPRTGAVARSVRLTVWIALGWCLVRLTAQVAPVSVTSGSSRGLLLGASVLCSVVVLGWSWSWTRRGGVDRAAGVVVGGTALLLSGAATLALHGTAWGFGGLSADASFRTEAATRYASSWHLADYAYAHTPAYYPPALSWLEGRAASVLHTPAWTVMQPFEVLLAAGVPLLAYWLWRRLLEPLPAAVVVAATSLLTVDLIKPDEWLVLMCAVPWWIDLVRGARRSESRRWPWWGHGIIAGVVLLTHTYYLLPLTVATLLGWVVDLGRRRPLELRPLRAAGVVVVALVLASPHWLPVVLARASGDPSDDLQLRFTFPGANIPPWPLPTSAQGVLGVVGVLWLAHAVWCARRGRANPLAEAMALIWAASCLTMLGGALAVRLGIGLLTFKTDEMVILAMVVTGALGLLDGGRAMLSRARIGSTVIVALVAVGVVTISTLHYARYWVVGPPVQAAQTTRYPSGIKPAGGADLDPVDPPAFVEPGSPSVAQVRAGWRRLTGSPMGDRTVLVTTRIDLLATTPVHVFTTWKSIYTNPLGQFENRIDVLHRVAACPDSRCAHRLLTGNPYDRVDGLVLARHGDFLVMPVLVDDFPHRSRTTAVVLPQRVVQGLGFTSCRLGSVTLVATRHVVRPRADRRSSSSTSC